MRQRGLEILALVVLLILLDQLYRLLHPEVNLVRASLVGASGYAVLLFLHRAGLRVAPPARGAIAIAVSALGSVLLIQAGFLVSRSPTSAAVHVVILALAYAAAGALARMRTRRSPRAA